METRTKHIGEVIREVMDNLSHLNRNKTTNRIQRVKTFVNCHIHGKVEYMGIPDLGNIQTVYCPLCEKESRSESESVNIREMNQNLKQQKLDE